MRDDDRDDQPDWRPPDPEPPYTAIDRCRDAIARARTAKTAPRPRPAA